MRCRVVTGGNGSDVCRFRRRKIVLNTLPPNDVETKTTLITRRDHNSLPCKTLVGTFVRNRRVTNAVF